MARIGKVTYHLAYIVCPHCREELEASGHSNAEANENARAKLKAHLGNVHFVLGGNAFDTVSKVTISGTDLVRA